MSPEQVRALFDSWQPAIMVLTGVIIKYVPQLKNISNATIAWINLLQYVITTVFVGTAHAAVTGTPTTFDYGTVITAGGVNAGLAYMLYETFGRYLLNALFRRKEGQPLPGR